VLAIYGPYWLAIVTLNYLPAGIAAAAGWIAAGAGGYLSGSSEKTKSGSVDAAPDRLTSTLELIGKVAPIAFLAGFLLFVSLGTHLVLRSLADRPQLTSTCVTTVFGNVPDYLLWLVRTPAGRMYRNRIMEVLAEFTPLMEAVSIDEAFLDVSASRALMGDGPTIAARIKARIREAVALAASVGVASNKFVAKVASDLEKPDGLVVVAPGAEAAFLGPLPIARLWGVGRVTAAELESIGVRTIGQLAVIPEAHLQARFGTSGAGLRGLALGYDDRPVEPFAPPKSMGAEETFERDHRDVERLCATLRGQAERVARELRAEGYAGRTVQLKLRFADFSTLTRRHTAEPTQDGLRIYQEARALLERIQLEQPVRLIGLSVSELGRAGEGQLSLLGPDAARRERLSLALDRLTGRSWRHGLDVALMLALVPWIFAGEMPGIWRVRKTALGWRREIALETGGPLALVTDGRAHDATKAAVLNLTMNLAREWAPQGIRVNALSPGFFPAEQNRKILQPERIAKILAHTPMNRFGEAGELMGPAVFLCARKAGSFVTGCHLTVDGGFSSMEF
jgi:DNA polymerase-4